MYLAQFTIRTLSRIWPTPRFHAYITIYFMRNVCQVHIGSTPWFACPVIVAWDCMPCINSSGVRYLGHRDIILAVDWPIHIHDIFMKICTFHVYLLWSDLSVQLVGKVTVQVCNTSLGPCQINLGRRCSYVDHLDHIEWKNKRIMKSGRTWKATSAIASLLRLLLSIIYSLITGRRITKLDWPVWQVP